MTIYTKNTDFQSKDGLATGNPLKIVKGSEIDDEFDAIAAADATNLKKDGTVTATSNIPMGTYKFTGLGSGSAATDSANLGQVQSGAYQLIGSISGVDTITGSLTPAISAYAAGQKFSFVSASANTGAVTININSLGEKSVTKLGTTALAAGDIPSGALVEIEYDGTQFQLCNLAASSISNQYFNNLTTVTLDSAADYVAIADVSDSGNAKKALLPAASTSATGVVELATDAEFVTGTSTTLVPPVSAIRAGQIVLNASEATTSGASKTSPTIPSWAKRVTAKFVGVSTSGTSIPVIRAVVSGSPVTSGYAGSALSSNDLDTAATLLSSGFSFTGGTWAATNVVSGVFVFEKIDASTNTWIGNLSLGVSSSAAVIHTVGSIALAGALEALVLTTVGGTDTFDAGSWSVSWE